MQVGKDEYVMFYRITGGYNEDGTPAESSDLITPGSNVFNEPGNIKIKQNKFEQQLTNESLTPNGVDGSTINIGTENQVQSMTKLKRCDDMKQRFMGINNINTSSFKQQDLTNKQ